MITIKVKLRYKRNRTTSKVDITGVIDVLTKAANIDKFEQMKNKSMAKEKRKSAYFY